MYRCPAGEYAIRRFTSIEKGMAIYKYWSSACPRCALGSKCTTSLYRRIGRWEQEHILEKMQARLDRDPTRMQLRRQTAEHPFGTIKSWMGATHFLCRTLPKVSAEMSLHVLAYNLASDANHGNRCAHGSAARLRLSCAFLCRRNLPANVRPDAVLEQGFHTASAGRRLILLLI